MEKSASAISSSIVTASGSCVSNEMPSDGEPELKVDQEPGNDKKMDELSSADNTEMVNKPIHGPRPPKPSSTDERIASVVDNPFFKLAGRRSPRTTGRPTELPAFLKRSRNCFDTNDVGDFKPTSGHVHKLSGKFASLGIEEPTPLPKLRHASSADDILDERDHDSEEQSHVDRGRPWASNLNQRVGSAESLSPRSKASSVFPVSLRHVERKWEQAFSAKHSPREVRTEAPDVKLARDDIILIENPPEPTPPLENEDDSDEQKGADVEAPGVRTESHFAELPKLNLVSAVRGMFEVSTLQNSTAVSSAENTESNRNDDTPAQVSSAVDDPETVPQHEGLSTYSGVRINQSQMEGVSDMSTFPSEDTSSSISAQPVPVNMDMSHDQEESKRWTLDVKLDDGADSDSSRSSTPPPLPLSPPPALPLSPPPVQPPSCPPESSLETTDTEVPDPVKADLSAVQEGASDVQVDVSDVTPDASDVTPDASASSGSENKSAHCAQPSLTDPPSQSMFLEPVPPRQSVPPQPAPPRSVATVKATPVYHPIPFRSGTGVFRSSSVVPPSFTPNIKKSSPVVSVAPFRQNRAEDEGTGSRYQIYSRNNNSSVRKRERDPKDYCEVIVEPGAKIIQKESDEVKESREMIREKEIGDIEESCDTEQKVAEELKEPNTNITVEETDEMKDSGVNLEQEICEMKEPDLEKEEDEVNDPEGKTEVDEMKNTKTESSAETVPVAMNASEENQELKVEPSQQDIEPEPTENLWRLALRPVSRRHEDSQPKPVPLEPVPIPRVSSAPEFLTSSPKHSSLSEPSLQSVKKIDTMQSASLSKLTEIGNTEKVEITPGESVNLDATVKGEEVEMKMQESDKGPAVRSKQTESLENMESSKPVKGIPTIIANRLKQSSLKQDSVTSSSHSPGELFGVRLNKTQHRSYSNTSEDKEEIPHKRFVTSTTDTSAPESSPPETVNKFANVLKRKDPSNRNRPTGVSQIFDSSQLQKKRKEKKAAVEKAAAGQELAPGAGQRVDKSAKIPPCNIEFIGANVITERSLLGKNRKVKTNVRFQEAQAQTFEYPCEEEMLQKYLQEHPDEVLVLDEVASWPSESSSDEVDIRHLLRGGGLHAQDGHLLKANTSLAHSGSLQTYRGKYQQEYQLGSVFSQPEKPPEPPTSMAPAQTDPDAMQILPAAEDDLQTYSLDTSSDLLF